MRTLLLFLLSLFSLAAFAQPQLDADFSFNGHCSDDTIQFTDLSTGTIHTWIWKLNHDSIISSTQSAAFVFTDTGCFDITLIVENNSGMDSLTQNLCIDPTPALACNLTPYDICIGDDVCIDCYMIYGSDTLDGIIHWGDGSSLPTSNLCHFYPICATYDIIFQTSAGCYANQNAVTAIAHCPQPFDFTDSLISGQTYSFQTTDYVHASMLWDFDDPVDTNSAITPDAIFTFTTPGLHRVCLTGMDFNGCIDSVCHDILITSTPEEIAFENAINVISENGELIITLEEVWENPSFDLFDFQGRLMKFSQVNNASKARIATTSLASGLYILRISVKGLTASKKVFITN